MEEKKTIHHEKVECVVEYDYSGQLEDELTIMVGDVITEVDCLEGGWWKGKLKGTQGMFPDNFVKVLPTASPNPEIISQKKCRVLFSYKPVHDDELELKVDQSVDLMSEVEDGWWRGRSGGRVGVFPSNFVEMVEDSDISVMVEVKNKKNSALEGMTRSSQISLSTPTITTTKTNTTPTATHSTLQSSKISDQESMTTSERQVGVPANKPPAPDTAPRLPPKPVKEQCLVLFPYMAQNDDELSLEDGQIINIVSREVEDKGWWKGEVEGRVGVFPDNFVKLISTPPSTVTKDNKITSEKFKSNNFNGQLSPEDKLTSVEKVRNSFVSKSKVSDENKDKQKKVESPKKSKSNGSHGNLRSFRSEDTLRNSTGSQDQLRRNGTNDKMRTSFGSNHKLRNSIGSQELLKSVDGSHDRNKPNNKLSGPHESKKGSQDNLKDKHHGSQSNLTKGSQESLLRRSGSQDKVREVAAVLEKSIDKIITSTIEERGKTKGNEHSTKGGLSPMKVGGWVDEVSSKPNTEKERGQANKIERLSVLESTSPVTTSTVTTLSHPTADRVKAPKRRPPSQHFLRENNSDQQAKLDSGTEDSSKTEEVNKSDTTETRLSSEGPNIKPSWLEELSRRQSIRRSGMFQEKSVDKSDDGHLSDTKEINKSDKLAENIVFDKSELEKAVLRTESVKRPGRSTDKSIKDKLTSDGTKSSDKKDLESKFEKSTVKTDPDKLNKPQPPVNKPSLLNHRSSQLIIAKAGISEIKVEKSQTPVNSSQTKSPKRSSVSDLTSITSDTKTVHSTNLGKPDLKHSFNAKPEKPVIEVVKTTEVKKKTPEIGWNEDFLSTKEESVANNIGDSKDTSQIQELKAMLSTIQSEFNLQVNQLKKELEDERKARIKLELEVRALRKLVNK